MTKGQDSKNWKESFASCLVALLVVLVVTGIFYYAFLQNMIEWAK